MPDRYPCQTPNVCSVSSTRRSDSRSSGPSTRHTSTASALVEATAKRTPSASAWAPNGKTGTIGQDRQVAASVTPPQLNPIERAELDDLVIRMENVSVRRGDTVLVHDISWSVELDERWVVLGPNGAGKTTLLRLAAAELHPTTGEVDLLGERIGRVNIFDLRPRIGFTSAAIAQRVPGDELVKDVVVSAGYAVIGRWRERYDPMDAARADELLGAMGLRGLGGRAYGTLSEGERKRALIARALMTDP